MIDLIFIVKDWRKTRERWKQMYREYGLFKIVYVTIAIGLGVYLLQKLVIGYILPNFKWLDKWLAPILQQLNGWQIVVAIFTIMICFSLLQYFCFRKALKARKGQT